MILGKLVKDEGWKHTLHSLGFCTNRLTVSKAGRPWTRDRGWDNLPQKMARQSSNKGGNTTNTAGRGCGQTTMNVDVIHEQWVIWITAFVGARKSTHRERIGEDVLIPFVREQLPSEEISMYGETRQDP